MCCGSQGSAQPQVVGTWASSGCWGTGDCDRQCAGSAASVEHYGFVGCSSLTFWERFKVFIACYTSIRFISSLSSFFWAYTIFISHCISYLYGNVKNHLIFVFGLSCLLVSGWNTNKSVIFMLTQHWASSSVVPVRKVAGLFCFLFFRITFALKVLSRFLIQRIWNFPSLTTQLPHRALPHGDTSKEKAKTLNVLWGQ